MAKLFFARQSVSLLRPIMVSISHLLDGTAQRYQFTRKNLRGQEEMRTGVLTGPYTLG
jgi:hypothetical protein